MYRDTEGGHCQGACLPQWFFYVPLDVNETAPLFTWSCKPWEIHSLHCWRARAKSLQASPWAWQELNPGPLHDRHAHYHLCYCSLHFLSDMFAEVQWASLIIHNVIFWYWESVQVAYVYLDSQNFMNVIMWSLWKTGCDISCCSGVVWTCTCTSLLVYLPGSGLHRYTIGSQAMLSTRIPLDDHLLQFLSNILPTVTSTYWLFDILSLQLSD